MKRLRCYKFKWTEDEGYMYSVQRVAEHILRSLDYIAYRG
jgi:hypothetical protein